MCLLCSLMQTKLKGLHKSKSGIDKGQKLLQNKMRRVKEKEGEAVMEMSVEGQVLSTVPRTGLVLCPFVVVCYTQTKNDWLYQILTIR